MKNNYFINFIVICISLLILSSCTMFYDVSIDKPAGYVQPQVVEPNFNISGRFFIKTAHKNNYGNFTWDKLQDNESLAFRTPIGQTVAQITIESGVATLAHKDKVYSGEDLDTMMQNHLGFTLPMSQLHYWIKGVPLPNVPITKKLTSGFVQLGWDVEYLQWHDPNHPHIIKCSKEDLVIKLLIEKNEA
jgi:outer membrane lipoprotein LolB